MHDIVTKETWSSDPDNAPLPSDFNRIESNTRKVEENRQEETTARGNADTTLQNNIDSEATARANADSTEATARANADTTLQSNIDSEATARLNGDAGYSGTSDITDYPIGSIIVSISGTNPGRNQIVAPSRSVNGIFTLDAIPSDLLGSWRARGCIVGNNGSIFVLCQRIS